MKEKSSSGQSASSTAAADDRVRQILKTRARLLARPLDEHQVSDDSLRVVEFRLANERYAVEQKYVQEVDVLRTLTPLPCTPAFIPGIINVRGQILPVLDIRRFFDLPAAGITDIHRVIVVRAHDVELGILADSVVGVHAISLGAVQSSLPTLTGIRADYLKGVTADQIAILDVPRILTDSKIIVDEEVET